MPIDISNFAKPDPNEGTGSGGGSFTGKNGATYAVIAAPIQNTGSGFQPIVTAPHEPFGIDSIVTTSGPTGQIQINYAGLNATEVCTFLVVPDETLSVAGFSCGGSVGLTQANLNVAQNGAFSDFISYNGTTWVLSKGAASPFTFSSFTSGVLTVTHANIGTDAEWSATVIARGGTYRVVASTTAGIGPASMNLEFWSNGSTPALVTVPDTNMKAYIGRPAAHQVDPTLITTTTYPASDFWVFGIFRTN